jgi:hypothetical protein
VIFIGSCGPLQVTHFQDVWNPAQANQAYRAVVRDSLQFNPRAMGIIPVHRSRDDSYDVVGFRRRAREDV